MPPESAGADAQEEKTMMEHNPYISDQVTDAGTGFLLGRIARLHPDIMKDTMTALRAHAANYAELTPVGDWLKGEAALDVSVARVVGLVFDHKHITLTNDRWTVRDTGEDVDAAAREAKRRLAVIQMGLSSGTRHHPMGDPYLALPREIDKGWPEVKRLLALINRV